MVFRFLASSSDNPIMLLSTVCIPFYGIYNPAVCSHFYSIYILQPSVNCCYCCYCCCCLPAMTKRIPDRKVSTFFLRSQCDMRQTISPANRIKRLSRGNTVDFLSDTKTMTTTTTTE